MTLESDIKPEAGKQICRGKCRCMNLVDPIDIQEVNTKYLNDIGLSYDTAKKIIKEDGGLFGVCSFGSGFVTLGIKCQFPDEFQGAISKLN